MCRKVKGENMKIIAEIVALTIGYVVWRLLTPYLGIGAFFVGVFVAYLIRPFVQVLLGVSNSGADAEKNNKESQPDLSQSNSNESNHDENKGEK